MGRLSRIGVIPVAAALVAAAGAGPLISRQFASNTSCCQVPGTRNIILSIREVLGLSTFYSQVGQDKWVSETAFPGVTNGFFLDVGSGDGTLDSNTRKLEENGWTGICVDPFPTNMEGRVCQMFKEVVYSEAGKTMTFRTAGMVGGLEESLGRWKPLADKSQAVEFTTVTLGDILDRARAPRFIHFISLDIEGAELEALRGFPFDIYKFGALAVEHNFEETKRGAIQQLLDSHGYTRVHTWMQDDFYRPANP